MESQGPQKLKIKIGDAEFDAEGPIETLREQFERFMTVIENRPTTPAPATHVGQPTKADGNASSAAPTVAEKPENGNGTPSSNASAPITDEIMSRVFRRDGDALSLLALPRTDEVGADSLVALLYGYQRLMNKTAVTGVALMRDARQSGVPKIPRVDTTMAKRSDYVNIAGARRGRVYSLNNRGMTYAEGLVRRIVE